MLLLVVLSAGDAYGTSLAFLTSLTLKFLVARSLVPSSHLVSFMHSVTYQRNTVVRVCFDIFVVLQVIVVVHNITFISRLSPSEAKEVVYYQTISPKSLANSVLEEGGWSDLVVSSPPISQSDLKLTFSFIEILVFHMHKF